jgi:hypothetical protein
VKPRQRVLEPPEDRGATRCFLDELDYTQAGRVPSVPGPHLEILVDVRDLLLRAPMIERICDYLPHAPYPRSTRES